MRFLQRRQKRKKLKNTSLFWNTLIQILSIPEPIATKFTYKKIGMEEIGDIICIGDKKRLYYCFPNQKDVVAKARLAAEELYALLKADLIN